MTGPDALRSLATRLGLRRGQRRLVMRMATLHFAIIASYTMTRTARDSEFISKLSAQRLPYLYVAMAILTAFATFALGRGGGRLQLQASLAKLMLLCGASLGAFGLWFHNNHGPVPPVAFYLWSGVYGLILVSLFWALINEVTDPRQARQLFAFVGAGGILGGLVGGAVPGAFGQRLGPESMLYIAAILLALGTPLALRVVDTSSSRVVIPASESDDRRPLLRDPYVRFIALFFLLAGLTASLIDYQFKVILGAVTGGDRHRLTTGLGYYYMFLNAGALVLQLFTTGWLLRRLGAVQVSGLLPAGLIVGAVVALLKPAGLLFAGALRAYEAGMRVSLAKSAWEFLYFPLPSSRRLRVKTFVDAVVDRSAEAVAGISILIIAAIFGTGARSLPAATLACTIAWLVLNVRLKDAYVRQLSASIRNMLAGDPTPEAPGEAQIIEEAHRLLASSFEKRALYAFELLERFDADGLDRRLGELLDHPAPALRARALTRLADPARPLASPFLGSLLHDESPEVRQAAIRSYTTLYDDSREQVERLLGSDDADARTAALLHLVSQPGTVPEERIVELVEPLFHNGSIDNRLGLAQALAARPGPSPLHRILLRLLDDPDLEVRRAALTAAGQIGLREFVPALVQQLRHAATREAARSALAAFHDRVVGTLGDYLADPEVPLAVRRELPRVLSRIGTQTSANELLRVPLSVDPMLQMTLLQAQNAIRERSSDVVFPRPSVRAAMERDIELFLLVSAHLDVWRDEPSGRGRDVLFASLKERSEATFSAIFRRLRLLYPPHEIKLGYRALSEGGQRARAQALEFLDTALSPEDRRLIVPLLEEPERRPTLARALYGIRPFTRTTSLEALVRGPDPWLQACALYAIGAERWHDLWALVEAKLDATAPLVRETAAWSAQQMETT